MTRRALHSAPQSVHPSSPGLTQDDIKGIIHAELADLLPQILLDAPSARLAISGAMEMALEANDPVFLAELEAQLAAIAELEKIKVTKAALRTGVAVMRTGIRVGLAAMGGA